MQLRVNGSLRDSIVGCILGGAIGDAAGASHEGQAEVLSADSLIEPEWCLTDDTQLTLATCEAIIQHGKPEPATIAESFVRWFHERRLSGLGASTLKALRDLEVGGHWAMSGCRGERAAGNGAAMRIAPLAFCLDPSSESSRQALTDICRITHHNDEAYIGALAVTLAIRAAQHGDFSLASVSQCLPNSLVRDRLIEYANLAPEVSIPDSARCFGNSAYVVESVPFTLFAATRAGEIGFATMITNIISSGGDTDTNASLAGQVAGAMLGESRLPRELVERIPQKDLVMGTAAAFAEIVSQLN